MREIAQKAGVSTGNVYHHLRDKEAIFLEMLDVQALVDELAKSYRGHAIAEARSIVTRIEPGRTRVTN